MNAIASGAADYVLVHRALHNPTGRYHGNPMPRPAAPAVDRAAGLLRAAGDDRAGLQRVPPALRRHREAMAAVVVEARKNGAASRGRTGTVARSPGGVPRGAADLPTRSAASTATSRSTAWRRSCSPPPSGRVTCRNRPVYVAGYAGAARRGAAARCTGRSTTSWRPAPRRRAGCGPGRGSARRRRPAAALRRVLAVRLLLARGRSGSARSARPTGSCQDGGIDSDSPRGCRSSRAAARSATGRMHGVPQMLECYLQLAGRAATVSARASRWGWPATRRRTSAGPSSTAT